MKYIAHIGGVEINGEAISEKLRTKRNTKSYAHSKFSM